MPSSFVGTLCNVRQFLPWCDSRSVICVEVPVGHYTEPKLIDFLLSSEGFQFVKNLTHSCVFQDVLQNHSAEEPATRKGPFKTSQRLEAVIRHGVRVMHLCGQIYRPWD